MVKMRGAVAHDATERTADVVLPESIAFSDLLLSEPTLQGLHKAGFRRPSPIQRNAIPFGCCGNDLIVQAKSGTGKTLVFSVVALEMINLSIAQLQVLIIAPTREIAVQIKEVLSSIGAVHTGLRVAAFIGGLDVRADVAAGASCHIAVGTPGRVRQLITDKALVLRATRLFVLDEADQLVTESFTSDVNYIFSQLPEHKQTLVVSATFPPPLESLLKRYLVHPRRIVADSANNGSQSTLLLGLRQYICVTLPHTSILVRVRNKTKKLIGILSSLSFRQCLIFCNLQSRMEGICEQLAAEGWPALSLAGSMPQKERLAVVAALQTQRCRVLLTTDLAARGIDAEQVDVVVNMDLPYNSDTYLHRVGRAGRFGAPGVAITIAEDGVELTTFRHMLWDVARDGFLVPRLPDTELTPAVWLPEAVLDQIESLKREQQERQETERPLRRKSAKENGHSTGYPDKLEDIEHVEDSQCVVTEEIDDILPRWTSSVSNGKGAEYKKSNSKKRLAIARKSQKGLPSLNGGESVESVGSNGVSEMNAKERSRSADSEGLIAKNEEIFPASAVATSLAENVVLTDLQKYQIERSQAIYILRSYLRTPMISEDFQPPTFEQLKSLFNTGSFNNGVAERTQPAMPECDEIDLVRAFQSLKVGENFQCHEKNDQSPPDPQCQPVTSEFKRHLDRCIEHTHRAFSKDETQSCSSHFSGKNLEKTDSESSEVDEGASSSYEGSQSSEYTTNYNHVLKTFKERIDLGETYTDTDSDAFENVQSNYYKPTAGSSKNIKKGIHELNESDSDSSHNNSEDSDEFCSDDFELELESSASDEDDTSTCASRYCSRSNDKTKKNYSGRHSESSKDVICRDKSCRVCNAWFNEYRRQLAVHRQYFQNQMYMKFMLQK